MPCAYGFRKLGKRFLDRNRIYRMGIMNNVAGQGKGYQDDNDTKFHTKFLITYISLIRVFKIYCRTPNIMRNKQGVLPLSCRRHADFFARPYMKKSVPVCVDLWLIPYKSLEILQDSVRNQQNSSPGSLNISPLGPLLWQSGIFLS